jgi:hypothetical protein
LLNSLSKLKLLKSVTKTPQNKSPLHQTFPVFKQHTHRQPTDTLLLQFPQVANHALEDSMQMFHKQSSLTLILKITDSKFCDPEFPEQYMIYEERHGVKNGCAQIARHTFESTFDVDRAVHRNIFLQ